MIINYILSIVLAPIIAFDCYRYSLDQARQGQISWPDHQFYLWYVQYSTRIIFQYIARAFGLEDFRNLTEDYFLLLSLSWGLHLSLANF